MAAGTSALVAGVPLALTLGSAGWFLSHHLLLPAAIALPPLLLKFIIPEAL